VSNTVAQRRSRPGLCSSIGLPDGSSLDPWPAGPPDGEPLIFHHATPGARIPFDNQRHQTLLVDAFPRILDELLAAGG